MKRHLMENILNIPRSHTINCVSLEISLFVLGSLTNQSNLEHISVPSIHCKCTISLIC